MKGKTFTLIETLIFTKQTKLLNFLGKSHQGKQKFHLIIIYNFQI